MTDEHLKLECMKLVVAQFRDFISRPEELIEMASKLHSFAVGKPVISKPLTFPAGGSSK